MARLNFSFFLLLALLSFSKSAISQAYIFADMPWGISVNEVRNHLATKGFKSTSIDKDGDLRFEGELIGFKTIGFAIFSNGALAKVTVSLITPDNKAREVYRDLRQTLVQKYGEPQHTFETYQRPYFRGDGYEDSAIRLGKATFATYWTGASKGDGLAIEITERLTVRVVYEAANWGDESERRRAKSRSVF